MSVEPVRLIDQRWGQTRHKMLISAQISESEREADAAGVSQRVHRQAQMEMTREHVTDVYKFRKLSLGLSCVLLL